MITQNFPNWIQAQLILNQVLEYLSSVIFCTLKCQSLIPQRPILLVKKIKSPAFAPLFEFDLFGIENYPLTESENWIFRSLCYVPSQFQFQQLCMIPFRSFHYFLRQGSGADSFFFTGQLKNRIGKNCFPPIA